MQEKLFKIVIDGDYLIIYDSQDLQILQVNYKMVKNFNAKKLADVNKHLRSMIGGQILNSLGLD